MTLDYKNKTVSVVGLGISNTPLIEWLLERGALITARDKKNFENLPQSVQNFSDCGVKFVCGEDYLKEICDEVVFRAPGIRYDTQGFLDAAARGSEIISEMELFFELCPAKIIGVTGSDGKTTTTTLIYKCLAAEYGEERVFVGGNIGKPLLPELDKMNGETFAVVELSSFQLQSMKRSPDISLITNISPNHLDYHKSMGEYIEAKKNIFLHAKQGSVVALNGKNEITARLGDDVPSGCEVRYFVKGEVEEKDGFICRGSEKILQTSDILLPGNHNIENYCGVICALQGLVKDETIVNVAKTFGGVEHRCELVRELDGVKYYNSSIDSSPTRTDAALRSFKQELIVICGGYDKNIPFEPLAVSLCDTAKTVVLTGATREKIKTALTSYDGYREGKPAIIEEPDFEKAVLAAHNAAKRGDIIILSPACASFDVFPNFEVRGNTFKNIINSLCPDK